MLKFLGFILILALLVGAWGYHRGWFSVSETNASGSEQVTFGLDKEKLKQDLHSAHSTLDQKMRDFEAQLAKLKERAKAASADQRVALDRQIQELEGDRDRISNKLTDLKSASGDKAKQLGDEIHAALDKSRAALDKTLESLK